MAFKKTFGEMLFGALLVLFFVSSLILTVGVPDMYNSPDERAAALSVETFVGENRFTQDEILNLDYKGLFSPRSMVAVGAQLTPITFPGLPFVYGLIGKVVSFEPVKILTPLLAVLAVLAWRKLLGSFLSRRAALVGGVLLLFLSAFWFYSARNFMHNVPFLALFIFGLYFFASRPFSRRASQWKEHRISGKAGPGSAGDLSRVKLRWLDAGLAGLMLGLALLFRTSEVLWMSLAGLVFLAVFARKINFKPFVVFLLGLVVGILPFFIWNQVHFQNPWQLGYTVSAPILSPPELSDPLPAVIGTSDTSRAFLSQALFPFGFHPRLAWSNFVNYQLELTWWMTILIFLGLPFMWMSRREDPHQTKILRTILLTTFIAGTYLTFFYGSWNIVDNPDPNAVTLANSYARYWLPIYLVSTIPAALFIEWLAGKTKTLFAARAVMAAVLIPVAVFSARLVFFHPDDGLVHTREVLFESVAIRDQLLAQTEPESVIVVDRADKILFPHRRLVTPLRSERTYQALPDLARNFSTYYYGITLPDEDLDHLQETVLAPKGLGIEPVMSIEIETLYRFVAL